jgi:hypothetical protein
MTMRFAAAAAIAVLAGSPAFANCTQDLTRLQQAVVSAETGASTNKTGMPATKHQEQVLAGNQQDSGTETTASTSKGVQAVSPHQQQVTGQATGHDADQVSRMMTEAKNMAKAGDEEGCMMKVSEIKKMIGVK